MALNLQYFQCLCSKTASNFCTHWCCFFFLLLFSLVYGPHECMYTTSGYLAVIQFRPLKESNLFFFKYYKIKCDFCFFFIGIGLLLSVWILKTKYIYEKKSPFNCITRHTMKLSVKFFFLYFFLLWKEVSFWGFFGSQFLDFLKGLMWGEDLDMERSTKTWSITLTCILRVRKSLRFQNFYKRPRKNPQWSS